MTRAELSKMADSALEEIAGATCYEGREVGAISDVRRLVREGRELLALERVIALEHFRLEGYREQGFSDCDVCGKLAAFQWTRTAAQLKAMRGRKVKGSAAQALPVSWRCSLHVPVAFPELAQEYRDARVVRVSAEAVA